MAKYNLDKVKLRANVVSGLLLKRALLWGDQFPNSSIGDEFNYLNDKNRKEWKEGLRNCLNSISLTFTSRKKYPS